MSTMTLPKVDVRDAPRSLAESHPRRMGTGDFGLLAFNDRDEAYLFLFETDEGREDMFERLCRFEDIERVSRVNIV